MEDVIRFNRLVVIESLDPGDRRTGWDLYESQLKPLEAAFDGLEVSYVWVQDRAALEALIVRLTSEADERRWPIIHIEAHGNEHVLGLADCNVFWQELGALMAPLNRATRFNLIVTLAACHGAFFAKALDPFKPAPFLHLVSPAERIYPDEVEECFRAFYWHLLSQGPPEPGGVLDLSAAFAALRAASRYTVVRAADEASPDGRVSFNDGLQNAVGVFRLLAPSAPVMPTGDDLEREVRSFVRQARLLPPGSPYRGLPEPDLRRIYLEEICGPAVGAERMEQAKDAYFMLGDIPENRARFDLDNLHGYL